MRTLPVVLLLVAVASAEDWLLPRGDLQNSGAVKNRGPRKPPEILWKREEKDLVQGGAALSVGRLYYGVGEFDFVCRSTKGGAHVWEKKVKQAVVAWPAVQGDLVLFGGQDHVHYLVRTSDMGEVSSPEAKGPIVASPAVTETHCFQGSTDGFFYAIDLKRGAVSWSHRTGPVRHAAAVLKHGVFVANETGKVFAFDARTGKPMWEAEAGAAPEAPPMVGAGALLLPAKGSILRFDLNSGGALPPIQAHGLCGAPALEKQTLVYGTESGEVAAVDLGKASETRRAKVADEPVARALVIAGKTVYGAAGKVLFALDATSFETLWTHPGDEPFTSPIVADGMLYAASGMVFFCLR